MSGTDQIHLRLPARPEYGRVARVAAAHLALRKGFSIAEIDDLRLAMDEAAILLLGNRSGDATLSIIYEVDPDTVRVDARVVDDEPTELSGDRIERFVTLAGNLVDEWEVHAELGRISLAKRHAQ
ncbi:MAG: hypothetical protein KDB21_13395 [Acidimicrobiales bacterium]|nr:hypothetical protein [Acidimicrobiales bacterium]